MTSPVRDSAQASSGEPAACRLGRATRSRSLPSQKILDILGMRVCHAQGSATILVAPAGMLPEGSFCVRSSTEI